MNSTSQTQFTDKAYKTIKVAQLIQLAFLSMVVLYGVVAHVNQSEPLSLDQDPEMIRLIFSILGVGICGFAIMLNRLFTHPKQFTPEMSVDDVVGKMFTAYVLTWAIAGSCAVLGLIMTLIQAEPSTYITFAIVSGVTIVLHSLTEQRVRVQLKRTHDAADV